MNTCWLVTFTTSLPLPAAFGQDGRLADPLRSDPSRKGSVVNVNPVNTRPPSDTPEIRKYKKRFNSEILCAALWGKCFPRMAGKSWRLLVEQNHRIPKLH